MTTFMAYAILLSVLPLAVIFYARRQVCAEVFVPTSWLPKIIYGFALAGIALSSVWYLFVPETKSVAEASMMLWQFLWLCYFWVYTLYLLLHSAKGHKAVSGDQQR
jgi:hypothetical protein